MAVTTCSKCEGHSFELAHLTPLGTQQNLSVIQCAGCGTPVAVMDPGLQATLHTLKNQVAAIDQGLKRIAMALD